MSVSFQSICVASDFSETSDHALEHGLTLAEQFGAKLHLLHVIPSIPSIVGEAGLLTDADATYKLLDDEARRRLAALPPNAGSLEVVRAVRHGNIPQEICRYAEEQSIDLMVLGSHGRTGISHFLIGSVAERVIRTAPCPVLTVRHPDHDFVW